MPLHKSLIFIFLLHVSTSLILLFKHFSLFLICPSIRRHTLFCLSRTIWLGYGNSRDVPCFLWPKKYTASFRHNQDNLGLIFLYSLQHLPKPNRCFHSHLSLHNFRALRAFNLTLFSNWSRDSAVGIATRYGLDGRGSNPGEGEIFHTCPERLWGPPSLLYNGCRVFPGRKAAGSWSWPPTPI